jgi:hypothetical protein
MNNSLNLLNLYSVNSEPAYAEPGAGVKAYFPRYCQVVGNSGLILRCVAGEKRKAL